MVASRLNEAGLKATRPRLRVLAVFECSKRHFLSAEDVYRQVVDAGATVGVASIYRILSQLEMAGVLRRHCFGGAAAVFEINEGSRHDHLVCSECGRVDEFKDRFLLARRLKVAEANGYELSDDPLLLRGCCPACLEKRRAAKGVAAHKSPA